MLRSTIPSRSVSSFLVCLQLSEQRKQLKEEFGIDLRVLGIASSQKMMFKETGIDLDTWKQDFDTKVRRIKVGTQGSGQRGATHLAGRNGRGSWAAPTARLA